MTDKTPEQEFAAALSSFPLAATALADWPQQRYAANGKRINRGDGTGLSPWCPLPLKFLARVSVLDARECWPWTGYIAPTGYGVMGPRYGHRMAWEYARGPIPDELTIDHQCQNPVCCNPAHLHLLSRSANSSWQRPFRKTHCKDGHDLSLAENVYWSRDGRRTCKPCATRNYRAYLARRRAAA